MTTAHTLKKTLSTSTIEALQALTCQHIFSSLSVTSLRHPVLKMPEDLFKYLADKPWSMWLDSCNSEHSNSRFDIMVWQPAYTFTTVDNLTTINNRIKDEPIDNFSLATSGIAESNSNESYVSTEDPLALIERVSASLFSNGFTLPDQQDQKNTQNELPFLGGALGYFSYDLGRQFETLPTNAVKDIHQPDMAVGIYQHAVIYDRKHKAFYLVAPENTVSELENTLHQLLDTHQTTKNTFALTSQWQANMSKQTYSEKFSQVQRYLLSGDCYQINLAQRFSAQYTGNEFNAYLAVRAENQAPFSAFIRLEESAILSASPERFMQLNDNKVQTKPIKGTRPRSNNPLIDVTNAEALKVATKDRAENLMIVDLLRNDLSKVCLPGTVKVPEIFAIESFPAVHHLVSTVEGELDPQYSATDLLRGAFPGGSITGAPKIRAMEIIDELEPQRRHLYCGSIGYISACGKMDTSITIRTLICEKNNIHCWAGGGLVADSNVDSEYQETMDKVNKILPVLTHL